MASLKGKDDKMARGAHILSVMNFVMTFESCDQKLSQFLCKLTCVLWFWLNVNKHAVSQVTVDS